MTSAPAPTSPYAAALGERIAELAPPLRRYFSALPAGAVGVGEGVLTAVGTPGRFRRVLLSPLFRLLERRGAVCAGWAVDVPFTVRNRSDGGRVRAERTFHLPGRTWVMRDVVSPGPGGRVVDRLGRCGVLTAVFAVGVADGALVLESTAVGIRWGAIRLRLPRLIAPAIRLVESVAEEPGQQRVALTVDVPVLGRIHEYAGTFRYDVRKGAA